MVLVSDAGRRWFRARYDVREATPGRVLAAVEQEWGGPSSGGLFTLCWGTAEEATRTRGRLACRGAAFSVADQHGLCLYAEAADLERLKACTSRDEG